MTVTTTPAAHQAQVLSSAHNLNHPPDKPHTCRKRTQTMIKKSAAALLVAAGLVAVTPTSTPAASAADLPACATADSVDCTVTITNVRVGGNYCQQLDGEPARCEVFWPFRNPTVNLWAASGDAEALPNDYAILRDFIARQSAWIDRLQRRQAHRVERKDATIRRLRDRLHRRASYNSSLRG